MNGERFEVYLSNVAMGLSFRQDEDAAQVSNKTGQYSNMKGVNESSVSQIVQSMVAVNLENCASLFLINELCASVLCLIRSPIMDYFIVVSVRVCVKAAVKKLIYWRYQ